MTTVETLTPTPLDQALGFTAADLAANQDGALSPSQIDRLHASMRRTLAFSAFAFVVVAFAATLFLFFGGQNNVPVLSVIGISLTVVNAVVVGIGAQNYLRTQHDVKAGSVIVLEGSVKRTVRLSGRNPTYILNINEEKIIVPKIMFNAFEEHSTYRLYRAPLTKTVFTAEET